MKVQEELKKPKDNNNNNTDNNLTHSTESSTQVRQKLLTLGTRRTLRNALNVYLTLPDNFPPINIYELAMSQNQILGGSFNLYFTKGETIGMLHKDQNKIANYSEMPFLSQAQFDALQQTTADMAFHSQKHVVFYNIVDVADSILDKIDLASFSKAEYERFKLEVQYFVVQVSGLDREHEYNSLYVEKKLDEWIYKFNLPREQLYQTKLIEIKKSLEELKKLSKNPISILNRKRKEHVRFVEFKKRGLFAPTEFSNNICVKIEQFAQANMAQLPKTVLPIKDQNAVIKFYKESIYIADFQKDRLKRVTEKNTTQWIQSVQEILMCTTTLEQKELLRSLAKRLFKQKKICSEKIGLANLTYNFYELLQHSQQYPWINYLLEPSKQFLFFHSQKFAQLFPLPAVIDLISLLTVGEEIAKLEEFYKELDNFFEKKMDTKELADKVVTRFSHGLNGVNETLEDLRTEYFSFEQLELDEAMMVVTSIQEEKYAAFSKEISELVQQTFANKSLQKFHDYFDQFKQIMIDYLAPKLPSTLDQTKRERLITIWCQSWVKKYQKAALLEEMFTQSMEHIHLCMAQVEAHKSQEPKSTLQSGQRLLFTSNMGGRERSKSDQPNQTTESSPKRLPSKPPAQAKSMEQLLKALPPEVLENLVEEDKVSQSNYDRQERPHSNTMDESSSSSSSMRGPGGSSSTTS